MSDNQVPIQQWWPNYPNPVQMYLCWEHNNTYQLVCKENEIKRSYALTSDVSEDNNFQGSSGVETSEDVTIGRPPPSYSTSIRRKQANIIRNSSAPETNIETSKEKSTRRKILPTPPGSFCRRQSNDKKVQNSNKKNKNMRPYKKRSFHSHLQSSENNMEAENSEDSEKQTSPMEDMEKDKDKEGETKRRKRWKRKISRKQFRHHDIKLFTPGEFRSTPLLKQKDSTPTIPKKSDVGSNESITDLIVTTLGGQKQGATQNKGQMEEAADSTTKNDAEENNNTNGIQNNNNVGKHNLPAIIIETLSVRRRSVDNTNMPKPNFKTLDPKFNRRMSVDMPVLSLQEPILEDPKIQPEMTSNRQTEQINRINNEQPRINADGSAYAQQVSDKDLTIGQSNGYLVNQQQPGQNYVERNDKYNGHLEKHHSRDHLSEHNPEPMDTSLEPVEPENLSLNRRHSGDNPVDLSKKSVERDRINHYHQTSHQDVEAKRSTENSYSLAYNRQTSSGNTSSVGSSSRSSYTEEHVRSNIPNRASTSPQALPPTIAHAKESVARNQDQNISHDILTDTVVKITNLNMWQEVLQRLLKQTFSLQILDLMAHAFEQVELAKDENGIPPELKLRAQKLLSDAYSFIFAKLKQLNLDLSPVYVIQILGQSENTPEKNTLKHYMENIESIRKLAIDEARPEAPKIAKPQFPHPPNYLQSYRELPRSPPSQYITHASQSQYHRGSMDSYRASSQTSNHSLPLGHQAGQSSRSGGHTTSPGYLREASPKTGNHPISGGYSRETSPRMADHPTPMEPLPRHGDYSIPQRRSRGPSPQTSDHQVVLGLSQRIGEYPFPQGHTRNSLPKTGEHPMSFGHRVGSSRTGEYHIHGNSREPSPRSGDHPLLLGHPGGGFRTGGEHMQQILHQRPSPRSNNVPLEHANESLLRGGNHLPAGLPERPTVRSSDHSIPFGYPRDLQLQLSHVYNMPYLSNNLNLNPPLTQATQKGTVTRATGLAGRPRSKSHRNAEAKLGLQQHLRRSLSNPHQAAMDNPLLNNPYLEGPLNRMPPPRIPVSTHNIHPSLQPNNNLPHPLPNLVHNNKEPSIASLAVAPPKPPVPPLYSEMFYQNLHNHVAKGNPLAISVHPHPRSIQKNVPSTLPNMHSLESNESQTGVFNRREVRQKTPEEPQIPAQKQPQIPAPKQPQKPLITSPVEEKITSSTDHLEISKVKNVSKQQVYEEVPLRKSISPRPTETLKSIPVAVIVADKSMQITKERTATSSDEPRRETPIELPKDTHDRISVSSNSNDNITSSEENIRQAFDKEQEENNTEFLVWLEKLKSNEKLKSRFLSQMGIIKKEETPFVPGSDPIEIVDSDEEDSSVPQKDSAVVEKSAKDSQKSTSPLPPRQDTIRIEATSPNSKEKSVSFEIPIVETTSSVLTSKTMDVNRVSLISKSPEETRNSSPKQSLSKKDYIPPIALPYVPTSTGPNLDYSPSSIEKRKKAIYSPEIEPISPVGTEAPFVFPNVTTGPKPVSPLNVSTGERGCVLPDSVTSPTYHKRKKPLDFPPSYQSEESVTTKTDYPTDNSVKRRKSLDRPELTRSPRVAPSGKLCYVRESHMFLRYFDDTQVELFIRNSSTQDEELLRRTGIEPEKFKSSSQTSKFGSDQLAKTEIIYLPRDVEFSEKEDIPEVEEFIKETNLVEQFVPKDFADFYRYVTGFQIIKNKHPVSLQTFLTMYNTNRTSELLRKYLERDEVVSRKR